MIGEDTLDLYTDFSLAGAVVSAKITSRTSEYKTGRRKGEKYTYRMANLTLSDTNGLYDIMLYDPTDQQIETILQPGELIFINAMLVPTNLPARMHLNHQILKTQIILMLLLLKIPLRLKKGAILTPPPGKGCASNG